MKTLSTNNLEGIEQEIAALERRLTQKKRQYRLLNSVEENSGRSASGFETEFRTKDRSEKWASEAAEKPENFYASFRDFLSYKPLKSALEFLQNQTVGFLFKDLLFSQADFEKNSKDAEGLVVSFDEDKKIRYCNRHFFTTGGYDFSEVLGQKISSFFSDKQTEELTNAESTDIFFSLSFQTKTAKKIPSDLFKIHFKNTTGGTNRYILAEKKAITHFFFRQIFEENSRLIEKSFDFRNEIVLFFNRKGAILFTNKAFRKILGYEQAEIERTNLWALIPSRFQDKIPEVLEKLEQEGKIEDFDTAFLKANRRSFLKLQGVIWCKNNNANDPLFAGSLADVTALKKAKKTQNLYMRVAKLVESETTLSGLYDKLYLHINEVMGVESFLVMLKMEGESPQVPFYMNAPLNSGEKIQGQRFALEILSQKRPVFMHELQMRKLMIEKAIPMPTKLPKVWLSVPLPLDGGHMGVLALRSYTDPNAYTKKDLDMLVIVGGQVGSAIVRARNIQEISAHQAQLEAMLNSGTHLIWTVGRKAQLNRFNQNFLDRVEDYFQIKLKPNTNFLRILKDKLNREWLEYYVRAFEGNTQEFEVKLKSHTGEENWWDISLNPIKNWEGHTTEVSGIAHDITQKKITEVDLGESEKKFRNIFDSLQDVYFRVNIDGLITMVSPSVFELTGYTQTETIGKSIAVFYTDGRELRGLFHTLLEKEYVKNLESTIRNKHRETKNVISNFRLHYDEQGKVCYIEGVARDITELKNKTEELRIAKNLAEKSLEVKKRFLSNMSHEIRTPMNGIIGMIDLMMGSDLDQEQQKYVSTIKKSSETLLNILNDILDLSKIEAGKMELRPQPTILAETLDKLFALFRQNATSKNTDLVLVYDKKLPEAVSADETRLLQVLSNLTSNAIKFTENGQVTVHCKLLRKIENKRVEILFEIEDSGIGIAENHLQDLFKQFSQVETTYTKSHGGTGLGLAISKQLCQLMGGKIGVRSEVGQGSTFWFTVLFEMADAEIAKARNKQLPTEKISFKKPPKVLIVDDNEVNRLVAKTILEKAGCQINVASSGLEAIKMVGKKVYNIVFMDIQMPEMNGITTTKKIRALPLTKIPVIIAMTAFSMKEERESFLAAGMDDYIAKPIKANLLIKKVKRWYKDLNQDENTRTPETEDTQKNTTLAEQTDKPNARILNLQTAKDLERYGGKELVVLSYKQFEETGSTLLKNIAKAFKNKENAEIVSNLHTLKGDSGTLGLEQIYGLSKLLETKFRDGYREEYGEKIEELQSYFDFFKKNYTKILNL